MNGALSDDDFIDAAGAALHDALRAAGWDVTTWTLRDEKVAYCLGCFECWTKTPSLCRIEIATLHVARALRTETRTQELLHAVDRAGLFVLAFPLYVDALPYLATEALERIASHRQAQPSPSPASFLAIANCGFPEAQHNDTALAICQQFAGQAGFHWAGGLALGAGGAINGRPLAQAGGMARNVTRALDMTADTLAAGRPAPTEASVLLARPMMPLRVYTFMGDLGWRLQTRRNGVYRQLRAKPFRE
jgi:multimeric flavodoxin WrbA